MKNTLVILSLAILFFSCEKVINVDLNEANPSIVIEANYTAEDSTVRALISVTTNFFGGSEMNTIDNAIVTIMDPSGSSQNLVSQGNGVYTLINYPPQYGSTYTMSVTYNGVTYVSSCFLAIPVEVEVPTFEYFESFFGNDPGYAVFLNFQDPANTANYYQAVVSLNGDARNTLDQLIMQDDAFNDGNFIERPLFNELFEIGDSVSIELRSIDPNIYAYYEEIQDMVTSQNSAAPANPTYRWTNKGLGYFSAYGVSRKGAVVQ